MKRLLSLITVLATVMTFVTPVKAYEYDTEEVSVNITINDVTKDDLFATPVERTKITVTNFDVAKYGEEFEGLSILKEGVTYLHVLLKLHEMLYGAENVKDKFRLNDNGTTNMLCGNETESVIYARGADAFNKPQYVRAYSGDEVSVCIYSQSLGQEPCTFDATYVNAKPGEEMSFRTLKYSNNLVRKFGAEKKIYVYDKNNSQVAVAVTDEDGNFTISLPLPGMYKMSIDNIKRGVMENNSDGNETISISSEQVEEVTNIGYELITGSDNEYSGGVFDELRAMGYTNIAVTNYSDWFHDDNLQGVKSEKASSGYDMNSYENDGMFWATTMPWVLINVTNDLAVKAISQDGKNVIVKTINSENKSGTVYMAAYSDNVLTEIKQCDYGSNMRFEFADVHDYYKLFMWDGDMKPYTEEYKYEEYTAPQKPTKIPAEDLFVTGSDKE